MSDLDKTSRPRGVKPLSRENKEVLSFFVREATSPLLLPRRRVVRRTEAEPTISFFWFIRVVDPLSKNHARRNFISGNESH